MADAARRYSSIRPGPDHGFPRQRRRQATVLREADSKTKPSVNPLINGRWDPMISPIPIGRRYLTLATTASQCFPSLSAFRKFSRHGIVDLPLPSSPRITGRLMLIYDPP